MPSGIYKRTQEHKEKIGKAHRGKKRPQYSEEWKNNISKGLKGRKLTEKHKRKIGKYRKGKPSGMKGRKQAQEAKRKIGAASKGTKASVETKMKMSRARRGKNCHFWKGGITPENRKIRQGIEIRLWREAVFARDNWTCQCCSIKGGMLHSHHIKGFAQYLKLRFAIDNGITFCQQCHSKFHKIYSKTNNNQQQIKEFLQAN